MPPTPSVLDACHYALREELTAAGGTYTDDQLATRIEGLARYLNSKRDTLFTCTWKRHVMSSVGWVQRSISFPPSTATIRARVGSVFLMQVVGAGGSSPRILANEEAHGIDSFGTMDSIRLSWELRAIAAYVRRHLSDLVVGKVRDSAHGPEISFVVPLTRSVGGLPLQRHLPPDFVEDGNGRLGWLGGTVLLKKGMLPSHVVFLGHAGRVRMEITTGRYVEVAGTHLPLIVQRSTFLPDGRTAFLHVRSIGRIDKAVEPTLQFEPRPGLRLIGMIGGKYFTTDLDTSSKSALVRDLLRVLARRTSTQR